MSEEFNGEAHVDRYDLMRSGQPVIELPSLVPIAADR